ncbi:hypothetical protein SISNIDRAFT_297530 [Sistotremastrum niveocremeum HHB9708]|uniref:F-box domain-containing protein n=1 Tax=Sistotremastrum niveocremeum HHB9708 TaxID=1314777 RepID=A0A164NH48_9AGAM|nr:hypothetical protein SISNIDRAFT_297530 [Sistotremastrum niveocremeum HHB9708]
MSTAAATESYAPDELSQFCEHLKTMLASSIHHQTHHIEDPKEITRVAREMFHVVDSEVTQAIQTVKTEFNRRAAVDRLHDELILEILQYCVPTIGKKIPAAYSVCTRWRLIANSSPSLWTKMQLPMAPE